MPSHLSSLGFKVTNTEEFIELFKMAYDKGQLISSQNGTYVKCSLDDMVELYGQINNEGSPIGLNPHFKGRSRQVVKITELITNEADTELDGRFSCWSNAKEDNIGDFPYIFDCPNVNLHVNTELPKISEVQVMGIAHYIEFFKNDKDFEQSQSGELKYASESFIPCGMFNSDATEKQVVDSTAILSGHIKEIHKNKNPLTGLDYTYLIVDVLGSYFDIIVDESFVTNNLKVNGVVSGTFWLSGIITNTEDNI